MALKWELWLIKYQSTICDCASVTKSLKNRWCLFKNTCIQFPSSQQIYFFHNNSIHGIYKQLNLLGDRQNDRKLEVRGEHSACVSLVCSQRIANRHNCVKWKLCEALAIQRPGGKLPKVGIAEFECWMFITCASIVNWNCMQKICIRSKIKCCYGVVDILVSSNERDER